MCVYGSRIHSEWFGTVRAVDTVGGVIFFLLSLSSVCGGGGRVLAIRPGVLYVLFCYRTLVLGYLYMCC